LYNPLESQLLSTLNQLGFGLNPGETTADLGGKARELMSILNDPKINSIESLIALNENDMEEVRQILESRRGLTHRINTPKFTPSAELFFGGAEEEKQDDPLPFATPQPLSELTMGALRSMATENNIDIVGLKRKSEVILAIKQSQ
jgi:hypothetical protein